MPDTERKRRREIRPESCPHIFDEILDGLPREALLAVRPLSRYLRNRADVLLCRAARVVVRPGDSELGTCVFAMDGRLPMFYKYHQGAKETGEICGDDGPHKLLHPRHFSVFRETRSLSVEMVRTAVDGHDDDDARCDVASTPNFGGGTLGGGVVSGLALLIKSAPLEVVRTSEQGNTVWPTLLHMVSLPPSCRTWSHFTSLTSRVSTTIAVPPTITKLVLNLDLRVPDEGASQSEGLDSSDTPPPPRFFSPPWSSAYALIQFTGAKAPLAIQGVVVRFYSSSPLPESLQHPPLRGPVRSVSMRMDVLKQIYSIATLVLAQRFLQGREGTRTYFTIVDFPNPKVVHPRYLGIPLNATVNTPEMVENMFKTTLNGLLRRPFPPGFHVPDLTEADIQECLECVEFIDSETYKRRVGEETFRFETEFRMGQQCPST